MKRFTRNTTIALALGLGLTIGFVWLLGTDSLPVARASTYTVTNTNASGPGSLHQAILDANGNSGHDTIDFAPSVSGTIVLTGTLPQIDDDLTIAGPGPDTLSISGDNAYRVIEIASSTVVTISGLTIRDGNGTGDYGGGIRCEGALLLDTVDVVSNTAYVGAGMYIWNGSATLSGTQIISNVATGVEASGGGLYLESGSVMLKGGQIAHNAAYYGGGVYVANTSAVFTQTGDAILFDNTAEWGGAGVLVLRGSATLAGGQILSNTAGIFGGGVYARFGDFTMSQGQVISNAARYGGGVFVFVGNATLAGGQIVSNTATNDGGGMYVNEGSAALSGGQIVSNTASGKGGGVFLQYSSATFTQTGDSLIAHNTAHGTDHKGGGGVFVNSGTVTMEGGEIRDNTATGATTYDGGGGIYVSDNDATLNLSGGQIISNTASGKGGGVYVHHGSATLSGGQIISNTATSNGGGIYNSGGTLAMINTTVSGNQATAGSGGGTITITFTTIASNTADSGGYGIHTTGGAVLLQNTIVAHNGTTATNCSGVLTSNGHNLEYGDTCNLTATGDITDTNPLLGPLTHDSSTWVHPLQEDSPAIDAGICVTGVTTDQRGVTRPQGSACDIGAYEYDGDKEVYLPLVLRNY